MIKSNDRLKELAKEQLKWTVVTIFGVLGVIAGFMAMTFGTNVSLFVPIGTIVSVVVIAVGYTYGKKTTQEIDGLQRTSVIQSITNL